jgi:hypothetical protein
MMVPAGSPRHTPDHALENPMARTPTGPSERRSVLDHLVACLWWLIFLGCVGAGAAAGIALALWLDLPSLPGLLLIVACWLIGNAVGWTAATRTTAALTRRIRKHRKRIGAVFAALPNRSRRSFPRPQGTRWCRSLGSACP